MTDRRSTDWRATLRRDDDNRRVQPWLRDRGSLTARLQACGRFSVGLLWQRLARPTADEAALLGLRPGVRARVREVVLRVDGVPVVFAHTVLPCRPRGPLTRWLARLGTRSLGAMLFAHPGFARGALHYRRLDARHPLHSRATATLGCTSRTLWARRSRFVFGCQSVLVTEVFSPRLHAAPGDPSPAQQKSRQAASGRVQSAPLCIAACDAQPRIANLAAPPGA